MIQILGGKKIVQNYANRRIRIEKVPFHFSMAIRIPIVNCLMSFFAGFVVFAYMGYLCEITGQNMDNIIEAGKTRSQLSY